MAYEFIYHSITSNPIHSIFCKSEVPYATTDFHYHDSYELFYLLSGTRVYMRYPDVFNLKPDYISLTKPHILHATSGGEYSRICINFSKEFLLTYFQESYVEKLLECFSYDTFKNDITKSNIQIKKLVLDIHSSVELKHWDAAAHSLGQLLHILNQLSVLQPKSDIPFNPLINEICNYLRDNIVKIKKLSDLSNHFHYSVSYLSHLFKETTGFTLSDYLNELRINQAMTLLKTTNQSVKEIASKCGYEEAAYFCNCFKKKLNLTPLDYRKQFLNKKS